MLSREMFWWGLMQAGSPPPLLHPSELELKGGRGRRTEMSEGPTGETDSAVTICQPAASANTHTHAELGASWVC